MPKTVAPVFLLLFALPLFADVVMPVTIASPEVTTVDANGNVDIPFVISNNTAFVISGAAQLDFAPGFIYVSSRGADCAVGPDGVVRCNVPSIAPQSSLTVDVIAKPPAASGHFYASMDLVLATPPFGTYHGFATITLDAEFVVTTTADSGAGSLRQAITDANANCPAGRPCLITFNIGESLPPNEQYTIRVLTPLPPVDAYEVTIDGRRFGGGPTIELRGDGALGDGLVLRGPFITVHGLTIDGFWANGIVVGQKIAVSATISNNVIVANGLRGITVVNGSGTISGNTLDGNIRSGIFLAADGAWRITNNTITNNGASGIYVGPVLYEITIDGNTISGNHDFPIGTHPDAVRVAVRENSMFDNGAPFDIGMDGPGVRNPEQYPRMQFAPAILTAGYDPLTGDTVATIAVNPVRIYNDTFTVYVYNNRAPDRAGRFEAEHFLGTVSTQTDATVVFRIHADLRGRFLTAMTLRSEPFELVTESSSELSDGVLVQ